MDDSQLKRIVRYYIEGSASADMRVYGKSFLDHYDRGVYSLRLMMTLGNMQNARVLDVGCGFGWHALLISLMGDNEVVANDVRELMIRNINKRVAAVRDEFGIQPCLRTLLGDFMHLEIPSESFDAVFCNETMEHVHNLDRCFRQAYRVLRPGGHFVVANDNNILARAHLAEVEQMWEKRDTSWDYIRRLQKERPEENAGIKPYAVMRAEIIRREYPTLDTCTVGILVNATAGQIEEDLIGSARRFLADGSLPKRPQYSWCRNPITGEFCERQFNPFEVKQQLREHGFRVRLLQDIRRGGPLRVATRLDIPPVNKVLFRARARFVLDARKR